MIKRLILILSLMPIAAFAQSDQVNQEIELQQKVKIAELKAALLQEQLRSKQLLDDIRDAGELPTLVEIYGTETRHAVFEIDGRRFDLVEGDYLTDRHLVYRIDARSVRIATATGGEGKTITFGSKSLPGQGN